jgi:hypothetical protein
MRRAYGSMATARATVPIYYESHPIGMEIEDRERLAEVEEILEEEEQEAAAK